MRWRFVLGIGIAALAAAGSHCPRRERTVTRIVPLRGSMSFEYGVTGNSLVTRSYTVYGGSAASAVWINTTRFGFRAATPMRILRADGSVVAPFTSDATSGPAVEVPGSVAIVDISWDGSAPAPAGSISDVAITQRANLIAPSLDSLALTLNRPVELFFTRANPTVYSLHIHGVSTRTVDLVLDGPGRVFASDPSLGQVVLDSTGTPLAGSPAPLAIVDSTVGGIVTFPPVTPPRDTLLLTVTNLGLTGAAASGHARLSVNWVVDAFPISVWFNTAGPPLPASLAPFGGRSAATLTTTMNAIAAATSRALYQATAGHLRLASSTPTVFVRATAPPPPKADVRVDGIDTPARSHVYGFQDMPLVQIELDHDWFFQSVASAATVLAHELLHYRYAFPDEYREARPFERQLSSSCTWCRCPQSMMSGPGDELCWPGNHNPFGDGWLAARTALPPALTPNASMWTILAARRGVPVPVVSPPRVLRTASSVVLP